MSGYNDGNREGVTLKDWGKYRLGERKNNQILVDVTDDRLNTIISKLDILIDKIESIEERLSVDEITALKAEFNLMIEMARK